LKSIRKTGWRWAAYGFLSVEQKFGMDEAIEHDEDTGGG
jgi:hypothetical protein